MGTHLLLSTHVARWLVIRCGSLSSPFGDIYPRHDASSLLTSADIPDPPLASAMTFLLFMATTMVQLLPSTKAQVL